MWPATLESTSRAFIDRNLSRVIVLQPGERLVLVETSRRTEGGVAPGGGMHTQRGGKPRNFQSRD